MPNAFTVLGLADDAWPSQVKARYKELAQALHPDVGGSAETFAELNEAYREALAYAAQPRRCPPCQGKGKLPILRGFITIYLPCEACQGSGKQPEPQM